jgi:hypothetical protein
MNVFPIDWSGGVNLLDDPRRIRDNEVVRTRDLVPTQPGRIETRGAMALQRTTNNAFILDLPASSAVLAMYISPFQGTFDGLIVVRAPELGAYAYPFLMGQYLGTPNSPVVVSGYQLGPDVWFQPAIFSHNRKIYVLTGLTERNPNSLIFQNESKMVGLVFDTQANADDTALVPKPVAMVWGTEQVTNFSPKVAGLYRNRVVYGDLGPGFEDCIVFADPNDPLAIKTDALSANGSFIRLASRPGDPVRAIVQITQSEVGNPTQSALLVLKEYSAYIITGEPFYVDGTSGPDDMVVNRISYDCGCSSSASVVQTPYGLLWASWDDVWFFAAGSLPVRVGTKIRPAIANTPPNSRIRWHAGYLNGFYRLAVGGEGQGPTETEQLQDQWWLDLRNGPPANHIEAKWFGPQQYKSMDHVSFVVASGTRNMATDSRSWTEPGLYTCDIIEGTRVGIFQFDSPLLHDGLEPTFSAEEYDDKGLEITGELWTKDFDFGDPMVDKLYQGAEVSARISQTHRLSVKAHINGGAYVYETTGNFDAVPFQLNAHALDSSDSPLSEELVTRAVHPSSSTRKPAKSIQLRIATLADGILITEFNNLFGIEFDPGGSTVSVVATIPVGYYASITTLGAALEAALNAALTAAGQAFFFTYTRPTNSVVLTMSGGQTWEPEPSNGSGITTDADYLRHCRFCATIGFDPNVEGAVVRAAAIQGDDMVHKVSVAKWEFNAIALRARLSRRRPA